MVDQTLYYQSPEDPLRAGHRVEDFWVEVVDRQGQSLGRLDGVVGGQIDENVEAIIAGGGFLEVDDLDQDIDWLNARLQPWWEVEGYGAWPLGVFLASVPERNSRDGLGAWYVDLSDKTQVLLEDEVPESFSLPAGAVVTDEVKAVILSTGEPASSLAVTDSAETLTDGMVWEPGTTKLRIVNDLLAAIGYFAIRCNGWGQFVAEPYVRPQDRSVSWAFEDGPEAMHEDSLTRREDLASVPNRFILNSIGSGNAEALQAVAEDTTSERFSYAARGNRWISRTEMEIEATSQEVLDAKAAHRLAEAQSVSATGQLYCAVIPLEINQTVLVRTGGVDGATATVRRVTRSLNLESPQRVVVREVVS